MSITEACAHLEFRFPDLQITQAGGVCPFQAEGTLHGLPFYFRYRHAWAELRINGTDWYKPLYLAGREFGGEDQGWLDGPDFVALLTELIGNLRRAPIFWRFPGVQPRDAGVIKAGTPDEFGAWADTPEQAWADLHQPSSWLREAGLDDAAQAQLVAERQMSPVTTTVDDRVFPDPDPFTAGGQP